MKMKSIVISALIGLASFGVMAQGGGSGNRGGNVMVEKAELEATWNGKAGTQQSAINGVIIEWQANEAGEWVSKVEGTLVCKGQTGGACYFE